MYTLENPQVGQIAVSRKGHDAGRMYLVMAVLGDGFVLVTDGNARPIDKPKTKRSKHLGYSGESETASELIASGKLTDEKTRKIIKEHCARKDKE